MADRGTIVYVHGASDRAAQVADQVERIERQLAAAGMSYDVVAARWGEQAGADMSRIDDALPGVGPTASAGAPPEPLAELAAMGSTLPLALVDDESDVRRRQSDELLDICRTQVGAPGEAIRMPDGTQMPMASACRLAAVQVAASPEYSAARASPVPDRLLIDAVGRAVASAAAQAAAAPMEVAQTIEVRIAEAVLGAALATIFVGYLGIDVGPDLKRWATDVLIPHRARLVREAGLGPADIVLYQRSGERIRKVVRDTLTQAIGRGGPVVAMGNSLGGIILVDLLAASDAPRPDLLVTVGSQAPLLATFGALTPLEPGGAVRPFQPWLNIYDRRDLLSFVATRVWPGEPGITDVEVDLGIGFPDAHGGAYLNNADVFRAIREHPTIGGRAITAQRLPIIIDPISAAARFALGASKSNSFVEVDGGFHTRMGRFELRTSLRNVAGWQKGRNHDGSTIVGILRALLAGFAALGSGPALTVTFRQPVRWLFFDIHAAELAVEDRDQLELALAERRLLTS